MHGNEESVTALVFEPKKFSPGDPEVEFDQPAVGADSVFDVDEIVTFLELRETLAARAIGPMRPRPAALARGAEVIAAELAKLPAGPGVYRMDDAKGETLYVGKAKSLRKRVAAFRTLPSRT